MGTVPFRTKDGVPLGSQLGLDFVDLVPGVGNNFEAHEPGHTSPSFWIETASAYDITSLVISICFPLGCPLRRRPSFKSNKLRPTRSTSTRFSQMRTLRIGLVGPLWRSSGMSFARGSSRFLGTPGCQGLFSKPGPSNSGQFLVKSIPCFFSALLGK